jgi:hypothetical protein
MGSLSRSDADFMLNDSLLAEQDAQGARCHCPAEVFALFGVVPSTARPATSFPAAAIYGTAREFFAHLLYLRVEVETSF